MPRYPHLLTSPTDASLVEAKMRAMRTVGVPYTDGEIETARASIEAQAQAIAAEVEAQQGPRGLADKEIVALTAYLQRLGTDIRWKRPAPQALDLVPAAPAAAPARRDGGIAVGRAAGAGRRDRRARAGRSPRCCSSSGCGWRSPLATWRARPEAMDERARLPLDGEARPRAGRGSPEEERAMAADEEDKVLHELDGIQEYDNPLPGWLMAIWWGSLLFAALYIAFYALSFGEGTMEAEYRSAAEKDLAAIQAHFDANPLVPPTPAELLAGAVDPAGPRAGRGALREVLRPLPRRAGPGAHRAEPDRRPLDPRRAGRAGLPVGGEGLAGQGHAALGPRHPARGDRGARLLRAQPPGLEPADAKAPEGDPVAPEPLPAELA